MTNLESRWMRPDGTSMDEEDRGLVYDVRTLIDRRAVLGLFGATATTALLAACSSPTSSSTAGATATATPTASSTLGTGALTEIPDETAGPYPGDGSNGINVLDDSGVVRRDIRSSFGSSSTVAEGVPLEVAVTVRDVTTGDIMPGCAIYLWHCTREGEYSLYSSGLENENFLRGVQEADSSGVVRFTTVFPGCYQGRWPHIHFEVYEKLATAVSNGPIVKTSQIALPKEACDLVYATPGYQTSLRNLSSTSLASDNVFGEDGGLYQLATMSGTVSSGLTATLTIGV